MAKQIFSIIILAVLLSHCYLQAQMNPSIIAEGFTNNLIGIDIDSSGNIWVTEMGIGNDDGQITIIAPNGTKTVFMTGLPSGVNPVSMELAGPYRTYQLPNNKVLVIVGEGSHPQAEALLIVDKSTFTPGTPLTLANVEQTIKIGDFSRAQGAMNSNPYNVAWDAAGNIFIADAGANTIIRWDKSTDSLSIVATLEGFPNPLPFGPPVVDPVPTDIVTKPGGGFYVCQLTGFPFLSGAANVYNLDTVGNLSVFSDSLTCLTDLAFDPKDGKLCALEFAEFGEVDTTLNFIIGTAAVIKLNSDGSPDTLATSIGGLAASMAFDKSGNLYVTDLAFGQVLKFDRTTGTKQQTIISGIVRTFPNPFSEQITLEYTLQKPAQVEIAIYDLNGRLISRYDEGSTSPGTHWFTWNAVETNLATGHYIFRLRADRQLASGIIQRIR